MPGVSRVLRALVATTALCSGAATAQAAPAGSAAPPAARAPSAHGSSAPKPAPGKAKPKPATAPAKPKPAAAPAKPKPAAAPAKPKPAADPAKPKPAAGPAKPKPGPTRAPPKSDSAKDEPKPRAESSKPAAEKPRTPERDPAPASPDAGRAAPAPSTAPSAAAPTESTGPSAPPPVGPGAGAGQRSLPAEPAKPEAAKPEAAKPEPAKPEPAKATQPLASARDRKPHQKGPAPRRPSPTLPPGVEPPKPNQAAREQIAGAKLGEGAVDPELRALDDAERALFPKPLDGASAGWSWDLPGPVEHGGAEVVASGLPPGAVARAPADDDTAATTAEWLRSLTMPNLPVRLDPRVVTYLEFYRDDPRGKSIAHVWAKKSGRYAPALKAALAKAGLPTDLVWLSLIESGHNPTIVSPAGAAGLWQFMPDAGRLYGLTVDRWVDERLDPERATAAAVRYLSDLHRRFGNWDLAMAAYNMGFGGLSRAIRKYNSNDFWELARYEAGIPWETTLYVPKILAIAIVMNNKKAFGIDDVTPAPAVEFDTVLVAPGVPMGEVARAASTTAAALGELNPAYLVGRTPPTAPGAGQRAWQVHVPRGSAASATTQLARGDGVDRSLVTYVVRFGDTVRTIASAAGTSESRVRTLNELGRDEVLAPGTALLVPRAAPDAAVGRGEPLEVVVVPPRQFTYADRERVFYRVLAGDTLGKIAAAFGVTREDLTIWNSLDRSARLESGMVLGVFVKRGAELSRLRFTREADTRVLVAGTHEFFDYFEGQNGKRRLLVKAQPGDTLAGIGKRYGMSVGWMERVNRCSRKKQLEPGEAVVVYAKVGTDGVPAALDAAPAPLEPVAAPRPEALPPVDTPAAASAPAGGAGSPQG
ncbi:MAG: transglycosylase SLT domain-containing protein [Sorangiineae bacterium]|nr:transglycosylase SLT domain-containing protein [Polyangiaceae bacterium]MEB2321434.1 transglycosylase SLT domain-containing protein [Sorangiineae bacterium]